MRNVPRLTALLLACAGAAAHAQTTATVTVDAAKQLGVMTPEALGIGVAVWDQHMMDAVVPGLVRAAGFKVVRYPGGSYADIYHWRTHSATKGLHATIRPGTDFDRFMGLVRKSGATPLITVNYGTNPEATRGADPKEAAAWVRYANRTKHYGVRYWEIGNEVYGNGFYNGRGWEADLHAPDTHKPGDRLHNPKLGPQEYGRNMVAFIRAMKAEDPTLKVGAVLCAPGHWPDAVEPDWNSNVLKLCGDRIDFVVVHWYGEGRTAADVLRSVRTVPEMVAKLRAQVDRYCGANAKRVQIWMSEGDASGYNTRAPGALFAADHFLTWWESGAANVDWWDLHNGATRARDGGLDDQGILSNGSRGGELVEPPANTPFPPYYGVQLVHRLAVPGDTFLRADSSAPTLIAHAVRKRDGRLGVMLINEDPVADARVTVRVRGATPLPSGARYEYGPKTGAVRESKATDLGRAFTVTVPAYGIVVIEAPTFVGELHGAAR